jgi:chromosome segregation ATPase
MKSRKDEEEEDREEIEVRRAIADLAKVTKEIKKKNWERYKNIFPNLYAEEFGIDRSISPQIQKIVDKGKEKYDNVKEENKRLKEDIKEVKKEHNKLYKHIEKMKKEIEKRELEIEKRDLEIAKLKDARHKEKDKQKGVI